MCGGGYRYSPELLYDDPAALALYGCATVCLIGAGLALRAVVKRRERVHALQRSLETGAPLAGQAKISRRPEIAAGLSLLLLPVATITQVSLGRAHVADCVVRREASYILECIQGNFGFETPLQQLELLGLGALLWIPTLWLAAMALGVAVSQRLRSSRLSSVSELMRSPLRLEQDRYRRRAYAEQHELLHWLIRHPGPSANRTVAVALGLATALTVLTSGAAHAAWWLYEEALGRGFRGYHDPWDEAFDAAYSQLTMHGWLALIILLFTFGAALMLLRTPAPTHLRSCLLRLFPPRPRRAHRAAAAMVVCSGLCLLAALPLRAESRHPAPAFATLWGKYDPPDELGTLVLPDMSGPDEVVQAPELHVDQRAAAALDWQLLGDASAAPKALLKLASEQRENQRHFNNRRRSPQNLLLSVDAGLPLERLLPLLRSVKRAGYQQVWLRLQTRHPFEHPPLGVWTHTDIGSAARARLVWTEEASEQLPRLRPGQLSLANIGGETVVVPLERGNHAALAAKVATLRKAGKEALLPVGSCQPDCS